MKGEREKDLRQKEGRGKWKKTWRRRERMTNKTKNEKKRQGDVR